MLLAGKTDKMLYVEKIISLTSSRVPQVILLEKYLKSLLETPCSLNFLSIHKSVLSLELNTAAIF